MEANVARFTEPGYSRCVRETPSKNRVRIFTIPLLIAEEEIQRRYALLSKEEKARADQMRLNEVRRKYIASTAGLRIALARQLNTSPPKLSFRRGEHGKPYLDSPHDGIHFNLTHSHELAFAATASFEIGIDVEWSGRKGPFERLANRYFQPEESSIVSDNPKHFLHLWTGKEAVMKATGRGLSLSPKKVPIKYPFVFQRVRIEEKEAARAEWNLQWFERCDYLLALATPGNIRKLTTPSFDS